MGFLKIPTILLFFLGPYWDHSRFSEDIVNGRMANLISQMFKLSFDSARAPCLVHADCLDDQSFQFRGNSFSSGLRLPLPSYFLAIKIDATSAGYRGKRHSRLRPRPFYPAVWTSALTASSDHSEGFVWYPVSPVKYCPLP